jgi:hypothetical protein
MIGLAVEDQGRLDEAYDSTVQATDILRTKKGDDFQGLVEMRTVLARLERKRGRLDAAAKQIELGVAVTTNPDAAPVDVGIFWVEAAAVAEARGSVAEAQAATKRARAAFEAAGNAGAKELAKLDAP